MNLFLLIGWVIVCISLIIRSTEGAETHLRWKHAIAVIFLLLCFHGVVRELGWIVGHPTQIHRIVDLVTAPIPPSVSLVFLAVRLAFGLLSVVLCYFLSKGSSQARLWLLSVLPILYLSTAFDFFVSFNRETAGNVVVPGVSLALVVMGVPYFMIFRFYSNRKVVVGLRLAATSTAA